jgi:soluble lytic murein transglycosylase-like protein
MQRLCFSDGAPAAFPTLRGRLHACSRTPAALATVLLLGMASPGIAQAPVPVGSPPVSRSTGTVVSHPYAGHVAEASRRFGIPEAWIWSVMRVESAGNPAAKSHAGAIGLMQVMPGTYAELRSRYGLGPDAYDVRDNILAGAAYLREMHDRYGAVGMLAAYNAGPGRWEDHVARGRPLPGETVAYLARLGATVGGSAARSPTVVAQADPFAWRRAALFVAVDERRPTSDPVAASRHIESSSGAASDAPIAPWSDDLSPSDTAAVHSLFAVRRPQ